MLIALEKRLLTVLPVAVPNVAGVDGIPDRLDPAHRRVGLALERVLDRAVGLLSLRTSTLLMTAGSRRGERTLAGAAAAARPPASSGSNETARTPAAAARAWRPAP